MLNRPLFQSGISERVIQKTIRHWFLQVLRYYEGVSEGQHENVSRVLMLTCITPAAVDDHPCSDKSASTDKPTASDSHYTATFDQVFHGCSINSVTVNINPHKLDAVVKRGS